MLIGEVSKRTGFSKDTLRWYERIGLIRMSNKRGRNNYRHYDEAMLQKLIAIRQIKSLGFTLRETRDLLLLDELNELTCENTSEIFDARVRFIDQKITELKSMKKKLNSAKEHCRGNCSEVLYKSDRIIPIK